MDSAVFRVEIKSPHGKRAIENWRHWLSKVADEAEERWGIIIDFERIDEQDHDVEFSKASEHDD